MFAQPSIIRLAASGVDSKLVAPRQEDAACASVGHKTTAPNTPTRARGSDQETALAEPRRLHPKRQRRRRSRCSFVRHAPFLFWPLVGPSVPSEPLEAVRREGGVALRGVQKCSRNQA